MNAPTGFFTSLTDQLNRRASRAVLSQLGFRNDPLRNHLRNWFERMAGSEGSFLADPVFEATFGWAPAETTLGALAGTLLHPDLIRALGNPPAEFAGEYAFPADQQPYQHQIEACETLLAEGPLRSVLVTSGPGSGKTECFLWPILHDLATEAARSPIPLTGVRALFLYPLNALIKSQRDRLVAWSEPFKGRIRFCLYNGNTPYQSPPKRDQPYASEVLGRDVLRADPPPILVTNATMLEYLLVRADDRPILDASQGRLRWIVLDEAHIYMGSQAAEIALLLRRVLHGFGCRAEDVHFVATSATFAGGKDSQHQLQEFLAQVAGVPSERVRVIVGNRRTPPLDPKMAAMARPLPAPAVLREMNREGLYDVLAVSPPARAVRQRITEGAARLSQLAEILFGQSDEITRHNTLELLDLATGAHDVAGEPFLPLRGHFLERAQTGLWVCANFTCPGRKNTPLDNARWPFGPVFLERRTHCPVCRMPAFELVQCGECGAEYLAAREKNDVDASWLLPRPSPVDEDEFQQELEPPETEEDEDNEPMADPRQGLPRLLTEPGQSHLSGWLSKENRFDCATESGARVHVRGPEEDGRLHCPVCGEREKSPMSLFKPARLGAPFLLGVAIPTLLAHMQPLGKSDTPLPLDGRRLITFSDSRQGTARFAAKAQQEAERNYVRSLLYHHVAAAVPTRNEEKIEELRQRIVQFEQLVNNDPSLSSVLGKDIQEKRAKLAELDTPPLGRLGWNEAVQRLLAEPGFERWMLAGLKEQTGGELSDGELAHLCLLREFFRRSKRQNSLETLGLLRLRYPALANVKAAPAVWQQRNFSLDDWRDFLGVALNHYVRAISAVEVTRQQLRWFGFPGRGRYLISPGESGKPRQQASWPQARGGSLRNRLVILLAHALQLDAKTPEGASLINELLVAAWQTLGNAGLLQSFEEGYRLSLPQTAEIAEVRQAWLCPITRRLLPLAFRGLSPYMPNGANQGLAQCLRVEMPRVPNAFWHNADSEDINHWLENDERILRLRELGAWPELSDRIASHARFFRVKEHSAQISARKLEQREKLFKEGKLNVLSCSTTMEMGVDIGGLSAVAMNNVPPHPANFLQRAGRAGRRRETAAASFTLCKASPHGDAVFRNPLWPFITPLAAPLVSLQSERIVSRHINALVLAAFLGRHSQNLHRLTAHWFFDATTPDVTAPHARFAEWCRSDANQDVHLMQGIGQLVRRSCLEGLEASALLTVTADAIEQTAAGWREEIDALRDQLELVRGRQGIQVNSPAERALKIQCQRIEDEYLLSELANRGFLPGHGFPINVVSLRTTTAKMLRNESPSRDLAIALRDYAPGTDTVLDGRVYRSSGITLNWHIPADQDGPPEIQAIRWVWRCGSCGGSGTRPTMPERCPHCGYTGNKLTRYEYLQPAGFAVDIRYEPHNDVSTPQYIPVRDPLISLEGAAWVWLPTPALGRYRYSTQGHLFHRSDGLHGEGYAVCLRCGKADSMPDLDGLKLHKRLLGGRDHDHETECPGNHEDWAIKRGILLGIAERTDILELQLREPYSDAPLDRITAYSLGVALRRALTNKLGIEEQEIGCTVAQNLDAAGQPAHSIYLYDTATGGAGYVTTAAPWLPELFKQARDILQCARGCDGACHGCLLSYDTQFHLDDLDRRRALALLDSDFLTGLELPPELQVFGPATQIELEPTVLALRREFQHSAISELRLFLGGHSEQWEPLAWRLRDELLRASASSTRVVLIAPRRCLDRLPAPLADELAALLRFVGAQLHVAPDQPTVGTSSLPFAIELAGKIGSVRWAVSDSDALAPGPNWGNSFQQTRFLRLSSTEPLPSLPDNWLACAPEALRHPPADLLHELAITTELNGASNGFGSRAWMLISQRVPELAHRLSDKTPLVEIAYNDRYLRSPLMLLLLRDWLETLRGRQPDTRIIIATATLESRDTGEPRLLHHDWRDGDDRRAVFEALLNTLGAVTFSEVATYHLPHARELRLRWIDGACWRMRLDQGLGYWRIIPGVRAAYPFDSSPERQASRLENHAVQVTGMDLRYPTFWYLGELRT
ncbi:MAG: DEAD/DEAH box helicase [Candidatus Contendobacter sp.]|nr:DEAD/DEAH box helicase [Candidatus Contendobacter sp.]MDG4559588.1 DEAD/DEAH box helicase [Candidatus Contendobacter sp.]